MRQDKERIVSEAERRTLEDRLDHLEHYLHLNLRYNNPISMAKMESIVTQTPEATITRILKKKYQNEDNQHK